MAEFVSNNIVREKLYAGELFKISSQFIIQPGSAINLLITPTNMHMVAFSLLGDGPNVKAELYRGPSVSNQGSVIKPENMRASFNQDNIPASKFNAPSTFTSNGTLIDSVTVFGPESTNNFGSNIGSEWILDDFEAYGLVLSNSSASPVGAEFSLTFYEVYE